MRMPSRRLLWLAFPAVLALGAWAQEVPAPASTPEEEPETIVITATGLGQPVTESIASATVVTARDLRAQGAKTVADALRAVPGVTISQNGQWGSLATASIRGVSAQQVLVLVDGRRMSSPAFGGSDLSKFPIAEISRIEIIRGPVSALYGSDAFGGVINIITRRPYGTGGETTAGVGSHGRAIRSLSLFGADRRVDWRVSGDFPTFDGTRPNGDYQTTNLSARVALAAVGGWNVALAGDSYRDSIGVPGATNAPDLDDRQKWNRQGLDVSATRTLGGGQFEVRAYRNEQRMRYASVFTDATQTPAAVSVSDSDKSGTTQVAEASYARTFGRHQGIVGVELRDERYRDVEAYNGAPFSTERRQIGNKAVFLQDRWLLSSATDLVLGARVDDHDTAGTRVTPRVGVTHLVASGVRVRASYAEGFRAPNFFELYADYPDYTGQNNGSKGNPNLGPENNRQYEVGVNVERHDDSIDVALFNNDVTDLISWQATNPSPGYLYSTTNIGRARQRGAELTWSHRFAGPLRLAASYTYLDAINRDTGAALQRIPHHKVGLTVSTQVARLWQVALTGNWISERPDMAYDASWRPVDVTLPSRTVVDLTISRQGSEPTAHSARLNPYLAIRNITNVAYEEVAGYPAEGRSVEFGVRAAW